MRLLLAVLSALCENSSPIDRAEQLGSGTRENRHRNTGIEELSRHRNQAWLCARRHRRARPHTKSTPSTPAPPRRNDEGDGDGLEPASAPPTARAPSGPNYLLFSGTDRLADGLRDRSKVGWSPRPHASILGAPQGTLDPKPGGLGLWPASWLRTCTDMYPPMEAPAHAL